MLEKNKPPRGLNRGFTVVGSENVTCEEILFRIVLRHYVSHSIDAITGTLLLNRFDIVQIHFVICI